MQQAHIFNMPKKKTIEDKLLEIITDYEQDVVVAYDSCGGYYEERDIVNGILTECIPEIIMKVVKQYAKEENNKTKGKEFR